MSMKKTSRQMTFTETGFYLDFLFPDNKAGDRFRFIREKIMPALMGMEDKLSEMYCLDNGRPGESPVKLVALMLLQCMERMPDRQAVDAMEYDLRWKYALRMDLDERGFHPTVLVRFRERLLSHEFADIAFKTVLAQLREAGYLAKKSPHRVDSTHIIGLIADMSRLECVMETIRLALEALESEEEPAKPEEWSGWWDRYVESKPDYKAGKEALRLKMSQAGADAHAILNWTKDMPQKARGYEKLKMLERVFDENFELIEGAGIEQRRAQPPGAVHNPHNPEAQWSSKNTIKNKDWIGHKVQVAETVEDKPREKGEPTAGIITAIVAQEAISSDKSALPIIEKALEGAGLEKPGVIYADAGYSSGDELARALSEGRELKAPVQPAPVKDGKLSSDDFDVSIASRCATCQAGCQSTNCSRLEDGKTGKVTYRFEWNKDLCQSCDKKSGCLGKDQNHRTLLVGANHDLVQRRRREQKTESFGRDMKHRNGIEGTISELCRGYGLRRARYRGLAKTQLQAFMAAAACNIKRVCRRQRWLRETASAVA